MALTNNDVLKKIRVALQLRDDDIIEILSLVDFRISKSELGAFFRKEGHPNYVELQDQILRNFLNGLVIYKRGPMDDKPVVKPKIKPSPLKSDRGEGSKPKFQKSNTSFKPKSEGGSRSGSKFPKS
jgi:hypothetical protein